MSEPIQRLDPDRAARERMAPGAPAAPPTPGVEPPATGGRRYGRLIGAIGLVLVLAISVFQLLAHRGGTIGVPAGQRLQWFSAPLAASNLRGDANPSPPCTLARHDPRALNVCLLAKGRPLVLAFFVTASGTCVHAVDELQALARQFSPLGVRFAAVAVDSSQAATAALVRSHHWTIPVAYDADGTVAALYRVAICPMFELARPGGTVTNRLIGDRWLSRVALTPYLRALSAHTGVPSSS